MEKTVQRLVNVKIQICDICGIENHSLRTCSICYRKACLYGCHGPITSNWEQFKLGSGSGFICSTCMIEGDFFSKEIEMLIIKRAELLKEWESKSKNNKDFQLEPLIQPLSEEEAE